MYKSLRNSRVMIAAALMAVASFSASASVIDGTTVEKGVTYNSTYDGNSLTLSIFGTPTGNIAGVSTLNSLRFTGLGVGSNFSFYKTSQLTRAGESPTFATLGQVASAKSDCDGVTAICFLGLNDALAGTFSEANPLVYKVDFDYSGKGIDFNKFSMTANFSGVRATNGKAFTASDAVSLDATDVPEPASVALMFAGLALMGSTVLRRKTVKA